MTVQLTLIVAEQHRQPAVVLIVEKVDDLWQQVGFYRDGQLVVGLSRRLQHRAGKLLLDCRKVSLASRRRVINAVQIVHFYSPMQMR